MWYSPVGPVHGYHYGDVRRDDVMKKRFSRSRFMGGIAALAVAGGLTVAGPAAPASAANSTPCNRYDFLEVSWNYGANEISECFANKGRIIVGPSARVDFWATGNNNITINYRYGEGPQSYGKWDHSSNHSDWHHGKAVSYIDIR
jgi:hypothetical protein